MVRIFYLIDDNEVHHLRKLCDEVLRREFFSKVSRLTGTPTGQGTKGWFLNYQIYTHSRNLELVILWNEFDDAG
jgi:hypothetical protein